MENQRIPENTIRSAKKATQGSKASRGDGGDFYRSRIRERREHLRSGVSYIAKALGKELGIPVPQLDVVACSRTGFKPDSVANHERGGLRFGFADST